MLFPKQLSFENEPFLLLHFLCWVAHVKNAKCIDMALQYRHQVLDTLYSKTQLLGKNKALAIVQKDQFSRSADCYLYINLVDWDWSDKDTLRQLVDEWRDSRKKRNQLLQPRVKAQLQSNWNSK